MEVASSHNPSHFCSEHFGEDQFLFADPGYNGDEDYLVVAPSKAEAARDRSGLVAIIGDVMRRHRFVVEYFIGAMKRDFPVRAQKRVCMAFPFFVVAYSAVQHVRVAYGAYQM